MCDINWLNIGKLTKPQGLKGEIRMLYSGNDPDSLKLVKNIRAIKSDGSSVELEIERIRSAKNLLILKFRGLDRIEDVEKLPGSQIFANRLDLGELEDGEYYWDDLIGMKVYDESDDLIGELTKIFETGSNDVYVVSHDGIDILIPAIEEVILKVDVENNKMYVHLLEGMRDDL